MQLGNGIDKLYNADKNNFGPRAGLAWDVTGDGKTSVRAGYALTYDAAQIGVVHPGLFSTPTLGVFRVALGADAAIRARTTRWRRASIPTTRPPAATTSACSPAFRSSARRRPVRRRSTSSRCRKTSSWARYHYFHTTVQREIGEQQLRDRVVRRLARTGPGVAQGHQRAAARIADHQPGPAAAVPLDVPAVPQHRRVHQRQPSPGTTACSCRSGRTRGTASTRSTTTRWSNCTDYNSGNRDAANAQAANPYDPADNKGPCDFDIRHNFNVGGSYEIPGASMGGGPLQIGAGVLGALGPAVHPRPGHDRCVGSGHRRDPRQLPRRADLQLRPRLPLPQRRRRAARPSPTRRRRLRNPPAGTLGTCGRNSGRRAGFAALDLNILKEFKLHGNARLQARWEIFNLTNRVNLGTFLSTSTRSGVFGQIGSTPDVDRGNPVIGSGGPRAMQWALKVLF